MDEKSKSGQEYTSLTVKLETLAIFQLLRIASGKSSVEVMEDLGKEIRNALESLGINYFDNPQSINIDIKRVGSIVQIGFTPKLSVKERKSKPIKARFSKEGTFKGVVEK